jgi:hypothetical protein
MATLTQRTLQAKIERREERLAKSLTLSQQAVRHKCFVSYHHADQDESESFIDSFEEVFIPRVLGVSDEDDFIDSEDTDYVMDQIRENYLTDSTVTIVLVGRCTWARRYVDWEVYSTLRHDENNRRSGLVAITLPSVASYSDRKLPARINDNVSNGSLYARWKKYPTSQSSLQNMIEEAFQARTAKASLIVNSRARKLSNSTCSQ